LNQFAWQIFDIDPSDGQAAGWAAGNLKPKSHLEIPNRFRPVPKGQPPVPVDQSDWNHIFSPLEALNHHKMSDEHES
jgi:hypothetical protein